MTSLWQDLAPELSACDPQRVCLGGTVFEFVDEWWKSGGATAAVHDANGYETSWNPVAHPDGFANEEWFGIVGVGRDRRAAYEALKSGFAPPEAPFAIRPTAAADALFLSFPALLGERYTLEESIDLKTWQPAAAAPLDATATELSFAVPVLPRQSLFYRIRQGTP